jgi:hypothetical protein
VAVSGGRDQGGGKMYILNEQKFDFLCCTNFKLSETNKSNLKK